MDGGIRTAVEGVDPREPWQATSTEGLHPPFPLPISVTLLLSEISPVLFPVAAFRVGLFSLPYP